MSRPSRLALVVLAASLAFVTGPAAHADLELSETGAAVLGKLTTMTITGNPGDQYLLVVSLANTGTLPAPHQPTNIDVGLELISLSFSIPGWIGTIGPGGTAQAFLPFPADIALNPLTLHFQALQHDGVLFTGKSNPCSLTPNIAYLSEPTLGNMSVRRAGHTMTLLPDGRHLLIGGGADGLVASYGQTAIELYDPCTQTFTKVGDLLVARTSHTATLLQDGRVLVAGGAEDLLGEPVASAEVVDPANNFQSTAAVNTMSVARALHGASLLPDGRVLVTGGTSSFQSPQDIVSNSTKSTEFYDPGTNSFSAGPDLAVPRVGQTTTTLDNGQVLIAGGFSFVTIIFTIPFISDDAEVYTPVDNQPGSFGAPILMTQDRFAHSAIKKSDGKVLLFGGAQDVFGDPFNPVATATVEEFDPSNGSFTFHGTMSIARGGCAVALLPNDVVIVAGGASGGISQPIPDATCDIYGGTSGLQQTVQMQHVRGYFSATRLANGAILLAGGGEEGMAPNELAFDDAELLTLP